MKIAGHFANPYLIRDAREEFRRVIDALDDGYYGNEVNWSVDVGWPVDGLTQQYEPWSFRAPCGKTDSRYVLAWVRSSGAFLAIYPNGRVIASGRRHSMQEFVPKLLLQAVWNPPVSRFEDEDGNPVLYVDYLETQRGDCHPFLPVPGAKPGNRYGT